MSAGDCVGRRSYIGLFGISMATLMYEILLTRIFSVTMWYHFAFVAVSVAMCGMTLGAVAVYLLPRCFPAGSEKRRVGLFALLFSLTIVSSLLTHLSVPFRNDGSILSIYSIVLTYAALCVPFVCSGICVSLALTRFPSRTGRLYAADLAGAATGCILLFPLMSLTDGPTAVVWVAVLAGVSGLLFLNDRGLTGPAGGWGLRAATAGVCVLLAAFAMASTDNVRHQRPLLRPVWVKGAAETTPRYEKWNSFSRVSVTETSLQPPIGWGISREYPRDRVFYQGWLYIDAGAGTPLTYFKGDLGQVDFLRYDVVNVAHYIRQPADVLVVGTGGGRDILAALAFDQKSVVGVEVNANVLHAVNEVFGDLTGHLDRHPKVTFVCDEARSYIRRSQRRFDIIQVSMIDTWAATAAGAYVMTENSLYTIEAWTTFLDHLSPSGVLAVSRWYAGTKPGEMYRLVSLSAAALRGRGVVDTRAHMMIVRNGPVGTMLISTHPFSPADVQKVADTCTRMGYSLVLTPTFAADGTFEKLAAGTDLDATAADSSLDLSPPTDDRPFFFNMLRPGGIFRASSDQGVTEFNVHAVRVLAVLLLGMLGLTLLCILIPLLLTRRQRSVRRQFPLFVFFGAIGLAFILVEISQMQRLTVFLGHPVYGLAVVLFSLLLASGMGSLIAPRPDQSSGARASILCLLGLLAVGALFGWLSPLVVERFSAATTPVRVTVAVAMLFPMGLFMGMPFPLGMQLASVRAPALTPWLWGINGATSVLGSVLAVAVGILSGISVTFWSALACYLLAVLAFCYARWQRVESAVADTAECAVSAVGSAQAGLVD